MMARDLKEIDCERMYNAFRRFGRKQRECCSKTKRSRLYGSVFRL